MLELFAVFAWLFSVAVAAAFAQGKGHSPAAWGVAALFFGPLAVLYVGLAPVYQENLDEAAVRNKTRDRCSACQELVHPKASKCPHCGSSFAAGGNTG